MEPDKLARLKEYGEFILRKIDSVPQRPSQEEDWVPTSLDDCLLRLREAAEKTVELATSPVKIGVMGEYRAHSLKNEGFIHCSTLEQIPKVVAAFYQNQPDLLVF